MQNQVCKILGENIKKLRKARGLKQDELAEMIGIEIKSLSLIETGKGFVSAKTLEKLAAVLNTRLSDLFEYQDGQSCDNLYDIILNNLELIKNNPQKLETINIVLKSLI